MGQEGYRVNSRNPISELKAIGLIALSSLPAVVVAIGFIADVPWAWTALILLVISCLATLGVGLWLTGFLGRKKHPKVEQPESPKRTYDQRRYEESWTTSIGLRRSTDREGPDSSRSAEFGAVRSDLELPSGPHGDRIPEVLLGSRQMAPTSLHGMNGPHAGIQARYQWDSGSRRH